MKKIKALKGFVSSIISMEEGDVKEVELDEPTYQYWTSTGLIEEVKEESAPTAQETIQPAPEAVTTNEA